MSAHTDPGMPALDPATRRIMEAWVAREPKREIPWCPLPRPLTEATVALVSSAGVALATDEPFDQDGERANPWWGDPSFRVVPRDTRTADVRVDHLHVDTSIAARDLDCVLPVARLRELEKEGVVGRSAPSHYSFMGYLLRPEEFLARSVPAMIARMKEEAVDAALLVPV